MKFTYYSPADIKKRQTEITAYWEHKKVNALIEFSHYSSMFRVMDYLTDKGMTLKKDFKASRDSYFDRTKEFGSSRNPHVRYYTEMYGILFKNESDAVKLMLILHEIE